MPVRNVSFTHSIQEFETTTIDNPTWGNGRELRVTHANGWVTTLRVFDNHPFVQIHTIVHNNLDRPFVTASIPLWECDVDLKRPLDSLKSFGTGFLNPIAEAPGSFCFTAVVDPPSRNGVIAASLTQDLGSAVFFTRPSAGRAGIQARIDFGRYQVMPGELG